VEDGLVDKGSCLYVEDEDRLSRQGFWEALPTFQLIINNGVALGVDQEEPLDRTALNSPRGMYALNRLVMKLELAADESRKKSMRLRESWEQKRSLLAEGKAITSISPGWIDAKKGERPNLIPDRLKIVKRIFDEFVAGAGKEAIAAGLNKDEVPTFGRAKRWHKSYIMKILRSPAVVGVYEPHEMQDGKRVALDPIRDFYPKAINAEIWKRAQALLKSSGRMKARGGEVRNILAGLARCPNCGDTMTRVFKGNGKKGGVPKLVCVSAKAGFAFCEIHPVPLPLIEEAILRNADRFAVLVPNRDVELQSSIEAVDHELFETRHDLENLIGVLAKKPSAAIEKRVRKMEGEADQLKAELADLRSKAEQTESRLVARRVERLEKALVAKPLDMAAANAALRECFEKVVVDYECGDLAIVWRHAKTELQVPYRI
jgi:DNA invertase Pin-like site-specific DNA recombinase